MKINSIVLSGKEVLPFIEGGKGIAISTGQTSGVWACAGGVGTFSGVNADSYDDAGHIIPQIYKAKTRYDRQKELIDYAIKGGITQSKIAHDLANGQGRVHMNVLWEMGACEQILEGVLEKAKGLIHGITCGAGMPYRLAEICAKYSVYYHPIVSSARAFRALWKRTYHNFKEWLGSVVYEDPWLAGGHNGLSNTEDPCIRQDPYPRLVELRKQMNEFGLEEVPIVMAGGVWWLSEWEDYLDNSEIGKIAFQFGTRPLLTKESPIAEKWKDILFSLKKGDIALHRFSPTGFYSSAVKNDFLQMLEDQLQRQVSFSLEKDDTFSEEVNSFYLQKTDYQKAKEWMEKGFDALLKTPDQTLIFVTKERVDQIKRSMSECMGCLSMCRFSGWSQRKDIKGPVPDPRSFCIQRTLQNAAHDGDVSKSLIFAGHQAYRFTTDPFYKDGFIPTTKELIEQIKTGY